MTSVDPIAEWSAAQQRVSELVAPLDDAGAATTVPACPDWSVRELLSHMVGLGADVLGGDEPDDHNSTWTQRQVEQRRGRSVAELLAEWDGLADGLRAWMGEHGPRPLGDVVIHEQDIRGALGVSGAHGTAGLRAIRDRMVGAFGGRLDGLPSVALRSDSWTWSSTDGDADVVIEASEFDLSRALVSRRSAAQLRAWTTHGDISPLLGAFAGLGPLPEHDLSE